MRIRSRLLLLVLALLLPGVVGAGWLIVRTFEAERQAHERTLRETARALSLAVDIELSQHATTARLLTQSSRVDLAPELDAEDLVRFDRQARRAIADTDGWVELRSADRVLVDTRRSPGEVQLPSAPDAAASTPAASATLVDSPRVWPLSKPTDDGEPHAAIVEPVRRDGRTVLELVVALRPAQLQRIVDQQQLPPRWIGALIDSRGSIVARQPGAAAFVGRMATDDLRARLTQGPEGLFEARSLDGQQSIGYYSTSARGWTYVSAMPREQIAGPLPSAVQQVALGSLVLLALAVGGALWVSQRIVGPVHALKGAASRLRAGLPVEPRPTGLSECDEVMAVLAEASTTLRAGRGELERQVADAVDRTRQAEQRVSQSQRVEALGRLTGGVAHDFNNLLGVISNSAHLIQRHARAPELQMPVAATLRAVEAGSRLTQHLLRFAGRRPVRPQRIDLGRYLPELQELLRSVLGRHIETSVRVDPETEPIHVDSSELELAMINLALNARDAMPKGGELRLHAGNADEADTDGMPPGRYVRITCSDDGLGMEADLVERVFEPFFTTKAVGKGTGLGLSQVHGFAVQAGGSARLDSTPGVGTTVSMLLPAGGVDDATELPGGSAPGGGAAAGGSASGSASAAGADARTGSADEAALAVVRSPLAPAPSPTVAAVPSTVRPPAPSRVTAAASTPPSTTPGATAPERGREAAPGPASDAPAAPGPDAAARSPVGGARVLLVEDNVELGDVTAALLHSHGADVHRAADADEALRVLDSRRAFDVVLSDIVMPGPMDGLALARRLRRERAGMPIILTTGYSAHATIAESEFPVLRKPCPQEDLLAALQAALAGARAGDPGDGPRPGGASGTPTAN